MTIFENRSENATRKNAQRQSESPLEFTMRDLRFTNEAIFRVRRVNRIL